ncbi:MAG: radical SAM protein [Thermodesulfovibrionales bacterium]
MLKYKEIFLGNSPCNNKCLYCSIREKDSSKTDLSSVLSSLKEKSEENIALYGGDPTLRSDLFEIIRAARLDGYRRIKLLTNGRAFSDIQSLDQIMKAGCNLFEITLWGSNPSLHDYLTQTSGSFLGTIRGLENLAGLADDRFVCIRIPVCKENHADLENCVTTALSFNVNRIILSFQDNSLSFKQVLPHINNAINISIFNRIWIQTEGIPFCIMQGMEQHIGEILSGLNTIYERTFQHHNCCIQCIYKDLCPGIEVRYVEHFGDKEFSPVLANRYSQDIKALYVINVPRS